MPDNTVSRQAKSKRRLKSLIFSVVGVAGCLAAGTYASHSLTGPAAGAVVTKQQHAATQSTPASTYELDGNYLSFSYPSSFTVSPDQPLGPGVLQQNRLTSTTGGSKSVVVTITSLPGGQLDDDPSYHMRSLYPQTYQLTLQTIAGERLVVAQRLDSFEEVAFWPHAGKLATIALSGTTASRAVAEAQFRQLLQSVSWQ